MRTMQDALNPVQSHAYACAREWLHFRTHVMQERLDLAPMNVRAERLA
jgi:hypothetical protein